MAIIDKPTDYFNTITYSGNGSNPRTLTGVGFQPDWVWQKNRTDSNGHTLADAVRGANKTLSSDGSGAEVTDKDDGHLDAFTSDGFTVGAGSTSDARVNDGSHTYVAWNWKAGTSFTNDASGTGIGSIDSTGSASDASGFSIVSYTGTGSAGTIKHGLSTAPKMIIVKDRDNASYSWHVYHEKVGNGKTFYLNLTNTPDTNSIYWNDTTPTSSVFSVGTSVTTNNNTDAFIAYCFADVQGYSKFGSYVGNGNADGTFVYLGFKPAFVLVKDTSSSNNWRLSDNKRNEFNLVDDFLFPSSNIVENAISGSFDFLSNGFKARSSNGGMNASGSTYIYMAFAENPFTTSTGVPATAR